MDIEERESFGDWEDDDEEVIVKSLFSDITFPNVAAMVAHDLEVFGFDLKAEAEFITELREEIAKKEFLNNESFMRPILEDDNLLISFRDAFGMDDDDSDDLNAHSAAAVEGANKEVELTKTVEHYKTLLSDLMSGDVEAKDDSYYFNSYAHISIHETMLRDHSRTNAYAEAITSNPAIVRGKVVLDIGCGTGILSLLAARAGARKVVGVDLSAIVHKARAVVERNGLSDVITIVQGRAETAELPLAPGEVDVIVSEWMGYGLYFENMLPSALAARDKYLSPSGVMMPSSATLFLEAFSFSGADDRIAWWGDVYGFDMSDLAELLTVEAQVDHVEATDSISDRQAIHVLDIKEAESPDLDFDVTFELLVTRDGESELNAFVVSFDTLFAGPGFEREVNLSTTPSAPPTHWKQTTLWLQPEQRLRVATGDRVAGVLGYQRQEANPRQYDITLTWWKGGRDDQQKDEKTQRFSLS